LLYKTLNLYEALYESKRRVGSIALDVPGLQAAQIV
jgi:hypothetical protein